MVKGRVSLSPAAKIFDLGPYASDHQFAGDGAYIHLEIEALHRRARDTRDGSPADEFVGQEQMDVEDSISLGIAYIRPAEAERRHALLHRPEHEAHFLAHRL
jgi:hypothetical protein